MERSAVKVGRSFLGAQAHGRTPSVVNGLAVHSSGKREFLMGSKLRVSDNDDDESYHEGVVVGYEVLCSAAGLGECLRMLVQRRVVHGEELPLEGLKVVLIDMEIPQRRVTTCREGKRA